MTPTKMLYPAYRKTMPSVPVINTAEALFDSGLEGYDLEEAFASLSEFEQARYLNDPRRWMASSIDTNFN